jgi:restriction system protein
MRASCLAGAWRLRHTDGFHRDADQRRRREDAIQAGHRTPAEVDGMSGTEFEYHVAALCRRDGCTDLRRGGGTVTTVPMSSDTFRMVAH